MNQKKKKGQETEKVSKKVPSKSKSEEVIHVYCRLCNSYISHKLDNKVTTCLTKQNPSEKDKSSESCREGKTISKDYKKHKNIRRARPASDSSVHSSSSTSSGKTSDSDLIIISEADSGLSEKVSPTSDYSGSSPSVDSTVSKLPNRNDFLSSEMRAKNVPLSPKSRCNISISLNESDIVENKTLPYQSSFSATLPHLEINYERDSSGFIESGTAQNTVKDNSDLSADSNILNQSIPEQVMPEHNNSSQDLVTLAKYLSPKKNLLSLINDMSSVCDFKEDFLLNQLGIEPLIKPPYFNYEENNVADFAVDISLIRAANKFYQEKCRSSSVAASVPDVSGSAWLKNVIRLDDPFLNLSGNSLNQFTFEDNESEISISSCRTSDIQPEFFDLTFSENPENISEEILPESVTLSGSLNTNINDEALTFPSEQTIGNVTLMNSGDPENIPETFPDEILSKSVTLSTSLTANINDEVCVSLNEQMINNVGLMNSTNTENFSETKPKAKRRKKRCIWDTRKRRQCKKRTKKAGVASSLNINSELIVECDTCDESETEGKTLVEFPNQSLIQESISHTPVLDISVDDNINVMEDSEENGASRNQLDRLSGAKQFQNIQDKENSCDIENLNPMEYVITLQADNCSVSSEELYRNSSEENNCDDFNKPNCLTSTTTSNSNQNSQNVSISVESPERKTEEKDCSGNSEKNSIIACEISNKYESAPEIHNIQNFNNLLKSCKKKKKGDSFGSHEKNSIIALEESDEYECVTEIHNSKQQDNKLRSQSFNIVRLRKRKRKGKEEKDYFKNCEKTTFGNCNQATQNVNTLVKSDERKMEEGDSFENHEKNSIRDCETSNECEFAPDIHISKSQENKEPTQNVNNLAKSRKKTKKEDSVRNHEKNSIITAEKTTVSNFNQNIQNVNILVEPPERKVENDSSRNHDKNLIIASKTNECESAPKIHNPKSKENMLHIQNVNNIVKSQRRKEKGGSFRNYEKNSVITPEKIAVSNSNQNTQNVNVLVKSHEKNTEEDSSENYDKNSIIFSETSKEYDESVPEIHNSKSEENKLRTQNVSNFVKSHRRMQEEDSVGNCSESLPITSEKNSISNSNQNIQNVSILLKSPERKVEEEDSSGNSETSKECESASDIHNSKSKENKWHSQNVNNIRKLHRKAVKDNSFGVHEKNSVITSEKTAITNSNQNTQNANILLKSQERTVEQENSENHEKNSIVASETSNECDEFVPEIFNCKSEETKLHTLNDSNLVRSRRRMKKRKEEDSVRNDEKSSIITSEKTTISNSNQNIQNVRILEKSPEREIEKEDSSGNNDKNSIIAGEISIEYESASEIHNSKSEENKLRSRNVNKTVKLRRRIKKGDVSFGIHEKNSIITSEKTDISNSNRNTQDVNILVKEQERKSEQGDSSENHDKNSITTSNECESVLESHNSKSKENKLHTQNVNNLVKFQKKKKMKEEDSFGHHEKNSFITAEKTAIINSNENIQNVNILVKPHEGTIVEKDSSGNHNKNSVIANETSNECECGTRIHNSKSKENKLHVQNVNNLVKSGTKMKKEKMDSFENHEKNSVVTSVKTTVSNSNQNTPYLAKSCKRKRKEEDSSGNHDKISVIACGNNNECESLAESHNSKSKENKLHTQNVNNLVKSHKKMKKGSEKGCFGNHEKNSVITAYETNSECESAVKIPNSKPKEKKKHVNSLVKSHQRKREEKDSFENQEKPSITECEISDEYKSASEVVQKESQEYDKMFSVSNDTTQKHFESSATTRESVNAACDEKTMNDRINDKFPLLRIPKLNDSVLKEYCKNIEANKNNSNKSNFKNICNENSEITFNVHNNFFSDQKSNLITDSSLGSEPVSYSSSNIFNSNKKFSVLPENISNSELKRKKQKTTNNSNKTMLASKLDSENNSPSEWQENGHIFTLGNSNKAESNIEIKDKFCDNAEKSVYPSKKCHNSENCFSPSSNTHAEICNAHSDLCQSNANSLTIKAYTENENSEFYSTSNKLETNDIYSEANSPTNTELVVGLTQEDLDFELDPQENDSSDSNKSGFKFANSTASNSVIQDHLSETDFSVMNSGVDNGNFYNFSNQEYFSNYEAEKAYFSSDDDSDSDKDCCYKRSHGRTNLLEEPMENKNSLEKVPSLSQQVFDESLTRNPNERNELSISPGDQSNCDLENSLATDCINQSKVASETSVRLEDVLAEMIEYCHQQKGLEAVHIADIYISISSTNNAKSLFKKLLAGLFLHVVNSNNNNVSLSDLFDEVIKLMHKFEIYDKSISSYFIVKCHGHPELNSFTKKIFDSCLEKSVCLKKEAIDAFNSVLKSEDLNLSTLLDYMNYIKSVCNKKIPKNLVHTALEKSKTSKHVEIHNLCKILYNMSPNEVDGSNLVQFLQTCFKNSMWAYVAEMFMLWSVENDLTACICIALGADPELIPKYYEKFIDAIHKHNDDENLKFEEKILFGQIGTALMCEAFKRKYLNCALEMVVILHAHNVNYFALELELCQYFPHFYSDSEDYKKKILAFLVVFTAVDICLHFERSKDAFIIFQDFSWVTPNENLEEKAKMYILKERYRRLIKLVPLLNNKATLHQGWEALKILLTAVEQGLDQETLKDNQDDNKTKESLSLLEPLSPAERMRTIYNDYLVSLINSDEISSAFDLYQHSFGPKKDIFSVSPDILRGLVVAFSKSGKTEAAKSIFLHGLFRDVYSIKKPELCNTPWDIVIRSEWTEPEIKFVIEWFISMLSPLLSAKPKETKFEEWFSLKIIFDTKCVLESKITCLAETSSDSKNYISKTKSALQSMTPGLQFTEDLKKDTLSVTSDSLYNYWKSICCDSSNLPHLKKSSLLIQKQKRLSFGSFDVSSEKDASTSFEEKVCLQSPNKSQTNFLQCLPSNYVDENRSRTSNRIFAPVSPESSPERRHQNIPNVSAETSPASENETSLLYKTIRNSPRKVTDSVIQTGHPSRLMDMLDKKYKEETDKCSTFARNSPSISNSSKIGSKLKTVPIRNSSSFKQKSKAVMNRVSFGKQNSKLNKSLDSKKLTNIRDIKNITVSFAAGSSTRIVSNSNENVEKTLHGRQNSQTIKTSPQKSPPMIKTSKISTTENKNPLNQSVANNSSNLLVEAPAMNLNTNGTEQTQKGSTIVSVSKPISNEVKSSAVITQNKHTNTVVFNNNNSVCNTISNPIIKRTINLSSQNAISSEKTSTTISNPVSKRTTNSASQDVSNEKTSTAIKTGNLISKRTTNSISQDVSNEKTSTVIKTGNLISKRTTNSISQNVSNEKTSTVTKTGNLISKRTTNSISQDVSNEKTSTIIKTGNPISKSTSNSTGQDTVSNKKISTVIKLNTSVFRKPSTQHSVPSEKTSTVIQNTIRSTNQDSLSNEKTPALVSQKKNCDIVMTSNNSAQGNVSKPVIKTQSNVSLQSKNLNKTTIKLIPTGTPLSPVKKASASQEPKEYVNVKTPKLITSKNLSQGNVSELTIKRQSNMCPQSKNFNKTETKLIPTTISLSPVKKAASSYEHEKNKDYVNVVKPKLTQQKIVVSKKSFSGNCKPGEFDRIIQYLKIRINQKHKNLSPEEQHQKALTLAETFIQTNDSIIQLDRGAMKMLCEFERANV